MTKALKWIAWKSIMTALLPVNGIAVSKMNRFLDNHISVLENAYQV